MYSKPKVESFTTLGNNDIISSKQVDKTKNAKDDNNINKPVKVKITVSMEDKKSPKKRLFKVSGLLLCNKSVKIRLIELLF